MYTAKSAESYVINHPQWSDELSVVREILSETELVECIKWGAPCYTINGENIVGLMGYKNYFGLWFHQGVFLKDEAGVLVNAQEGKTKALRQWRMSAADDIQPKLIKTYVTEAIKNAKAGHKLEPARAKPLSVPPELARALKKDIDARLKFEALRPGLKREFANYISDAKRTETKIRRIEKILPMIVSGFGLNDKYR